MTFGKKQPRNTPIGIDIGARHVRAIQMNADRNGTGIATVLVLPREHPGQALGADELRPLPNLLRRAGFVGNKIVLATPLDKQLGGVIEMPRSDASSHPQMARMELARTDRCAPDSFELECWQLPAGDGRTTTTSVMAVACRHDDAAAFLDPFEAAGFEVETLDLRAAALGRAARPLAPETGGLVPILELNWQASLLVLIYKGELIYERILADADFQRVYETLIQRLQIDAELADYLLLEGGPDALAGDAPASRQARAILSGYLDGLFAELSASLAYATQRYPDVAVESLLLCGDAAIMPGLDRRLSDAVKIPVKVISPADLCPNSREDRDAARSPALVTAMGLALA